MEIFNAIISIILIIGMIILFFTVKNLLPSYFSEKGKNLATREDITELTTMVEEVKHDFTKQTENLKSNLLLLNTVHSGLISEERNAIVDFNEKIFTWMNGLTDTGLGIGDISEVSLVAHDAALEKLYSNVLNSEIRLRLFIDNDDLLLAALELKIKCLESFRPIIVMHSGIPSKLNIQFEDCEQNFQGQAKVDRLKELLQIRNEGFKKYSAEIVDAYKKVSDQSDKFQRLSRKHLYNLIENSIPKS